jgi:hypothetical protein
LTCLYVDEDRCSLGAVSMIVYEDRMSTGVSQVALWMRLAPEFLGSAFLAAPVIGYGIAAQRLVSG